MQSAPCLPHSCASELRPVRSFQLLVYTAMRGSPGHKGHRASLPSGIAGHLVEKHGKLPSWTTHKGLAGRSPGQARSGDSASDKQMRA